MDRHAERRRTAKVEAIARSVSAERISQIALVSDGPQFFNSGESHAVIAKLFSFERAMMRGCWQANRKKK